MNFMKYKILNQKEIGKQNIAQGNSFQPMSCREFQKMLDLLSNTNDIDLLVNIFTTIGICILTKNVEYGNAIKCDALYKKLALVLCSSLQTKSIVALNLISTMLYFDKENGLMRKKALQMYAKNMIRLSGCLTAMTEMFTSFMMHKEIWKALCRSISETCKGNITNQSHCAHLIPMCIQRCLRGNLDPVSILLSLLSNHESNVNLFHESNGMSMFKGELLRSTECLQLLNLVVENTKPEYCEEILKHSILFRELRSYLNKYGLNSSIGQWVSIILFSHSKVLGTNMNLEVAEDENVFEHQSQKIVDNPIDETKNIVNETNELLCNVLREAVGWKNEFGRNRFSNVLNHNYKIENINMQPSRGEMYTQKLQFDAKLHRNNHYRYPDANYTKSDLSFSYSFKPKRLEARLTKTDMLGTSQDAVHEVQTCINETSLQQSFLLKSYETSSRNRNDETLVNFKPPFVSTPKHNKHSSMKTSSRISREITLICPTSSDHSNCNKTIKKKNVMNTTRTNKKIRNRSMSAKFLDILNGSCTTIIKGIKGIFRTKNTSKLIDDKSKDVKKNKVEDYSRAPNFTKYIRDGDDSVFNKKEKLDSTCNRKELSALYSNFSSCNTCNDTFALKYKFDNDAFLQQTVKRLKMGINLYGCNFKKISRTMWPRETYMTPNVLYNLYRKLIINK